VKPFDNAISESAFTLSAAVGIFCLTPIHARLFG
jgi:hypothetical protein